ncbi:MAG TPA: DUF1801 domain-containing protein [Candidatus Polarisedimenticolaceae bacterium]|nr:DUF1801 domain-containing protein [Candidatus Polarisedimenticolaceae bacterium]
MAYEAKTKPTKVSVASYLDAIEDPERRKDCKAIAAMMKRVTGSTGKMWGTAIVGFGSYHYKYASGHEGDSCLVGFANRKGDITLYLLGVLLDPKAKGLLKDLGKHKTGKGCLYVKRLADVKMPVLEELVARSVADTKKRYAQAAK